MTLENYYCTACGTEGKIVLTRDAGCCTECGTPEHYKPIENKSQDNE